MGWFIALVIVLLLAILPLGASIQYDADGLLVKIIAGPIRFTVFPLKKKEKKHKKKKKKHGPQKSKDKAPEVEKVPKKGKGGSVLDFLPLVQVAIDFLGDFRRKLRLNRLELKMIMASGDPCDLAIDYGRAWSTIGELFPLLERAFVIEKRDIEVECDFTASETVIVARLDITITLGRIIALVARYAIRALLELLKIMNSRKGGASK